MPTYPSGSERELCARFLRVIPDQVNSNAHLVWRGRTLTAACLIQIGSAPFLLRFDAGSIRECQTQLPPLCPWDVGSAWIRSGLGGAVAGSAAAGLA